MSDARVIEIDAREMQPPEPMERVLEALDELSPGDEIHLRLWREPFPLYRVLERNGFHHLVEHGRNHEVMVRIFSRKA